MGAVVLDREHRRLFDGSQRASRGLRDRGRRSDGGAVRAHLFDVEAHGSGTLDELVTDTWEGLMGGKLVCCPACHGRMEASVAMLGGVEGGECADCGATLS
jgi:hypothetical protein